MIGRFVALLLVWGLLASGPVGAHGAGKVFLPEDGIGIASLTHGQMAVIANHRADILTLAARQYPPDDTLRRLGNYAALQRAWCFWGLMPGTIADESSPFNFCAHAYLAATRDALLRLQVLRAEDPAVKRLIYAVDRDMIDQGSGLALCQYSGDAFSTAVIVGPDWPLLADHLPSIVVFLALTVVAGGGLWFLVRPRARSTAREA